MDNVSYYTVEVDSEHSNYNPNGGYVTPVLKINTHALSFNLLGNSKINKPGYYDVMVIAKLDTGPNAVTSLVGSADMPYEVTNQGKVLQGAFAPWDTGVTVNVPAGGLGWGASSNSTSSKTTSADKGQASQQRPMNKKVIDMNGRQVSSPYGTTATDPSSGQQTTYMPIYYVMQALRNALNIQSNWDGTNWHLTLPSSMNPSQSLKSVIPAKPGYKSIYVNNILVETVPAIAANDPSSGQDTTYVPIWYIMKSLGDIGVQSNWNGQTWSMSNTEGSSGSNTAIGSGQSNITAIPTIDPFPTNDMVSTISGVAEPNSSVTITDKTEGWTETTTADRSGKYSDVVGGATVPGDIISVTAQSPGKTASQAVTRTVG